METISFDTSTSSLPFAPSNSRVSKITFNTCNTALSLELVCDNCVDIDIDKFGMARDSWWCVHTANLPDRQFRMTNGTMSMNGILRRYGFQDDSGCVHHNKAICHYISKKKIENPLSVHQQFVDATGVPQFFPNSGVCWFASLCTAAFSDNKLKSILLSRMNEPMRTYADRSLFDKNHAKMFRESLWKTFKVGDNTNERPEDDGCNGATEFILMCTKLKLPVTIFHERNNQLKISQKSYNNKGHRRIVPLQDSESEILVIRFDDGDHARFPLLRRIKFNGRRYKLSGVFLGQQKCGHQIAMGSVNGSWREWIIGDADFHKEEVGPTHIKFRGSNWNDHKEWYRAWKTMIHISKFQGGNFCAITPHNPPNDELDCYRGAVGTCNVDMIFTVH